MQYIASNRSTTNIFTSTCSQLTREQYLLLFSVRNEDRFAKPYLQYRKPKSGAEKTVSREVVLDSYSPTMARALMDKMKQDYDILKLPEPSWIEDATGEWLDSTDHHSCKE